MKKTASRPEQPLSKFNEPSYGSPQSAIMGKMGMGQPRSLAQEMWPQGVPVAFVVKPKRRRRR